MPTMKYLLMPTRKIVFICLALISIFLLWLVTSFNERNEPRPTFETPEQQTESSIGEITLNIDGQFSSSEEEIVEPEDYPHVDDIKIILFYVPFFRTADFHWGVGRQPFLDAHCPVNKCETTIDRRRLEESDAVIVHPFDVKWDKDPLPKRIYSRRTRNQRWIFHVSESADSTRVDMKKFNGLFNWTTCFRKDCDIYHPYMRTVVRNKTEVTPEKETTWNQTVRPRRLVSWLVSHCVTKGRREEYVAELRKYIDVDIYGHCGQPCNESCAEQVFDDYKFYLAFENSVCKDYFTEKLLNTLQHQRTVPIVYGGADYRSITPPNSVIDVRDFESPKHLAEYLKILDANDTLYNRYFDWKDDYEVKYEKANVFCELCGKLHDEDPAKNSGEIIKVYEDLSDFWMDKAECTHGKYIAGMPH